MQSLLTRPIRSVFDDLPGLLHPTCAVCSPVEAAGCGNAGGDRAPAREPWPGASRGIRRPGIDETPLSELEIEIAMRLGA